MEAIPYQEILREALREGGSIQISFLSRLIRGHHFEETGLKAISGLDMGWTSILFDKKTFYGFTTDLSRNPSLI